MPQATPAGRPRLSVAMIVRNEEAMLPGAIASVRGIADEIVVVDTGSSDGTREIALRDKVDLFDRDWQESFAEARNDALACVTGEWILWLDAGERIDAATASALRTFVNQAADANKAYLLFIEVPPEQCGGAAERIGQLRLVPNRPGLQFSGRVRESMQASLAAQGVSVEATPWVIRRTEREHNAQLKRTRALRNVRLLELEIAEQGRQPRLLAALGDAQATLGNHAAAAELFQQALAAAARGSTEMLEAWYGLLTATGPQNIDEQLAGCLQALDVFPFDAQLLCAMGNYLQAKGRTDLAGRAYESAVRFGQVNPETWHLAEIGEIAAMCLSTCWQLQNQAEKAREALHEALTRFPISLRLRRSLIDLEVKQGRLLQALGQAEHLPADFPHREAYRSAIRGASQAARGNWMPALAYLETAYTDGCREVLCLRWLVLSLWATDRKRDAEPILREWQAAEPRNADVQRYLDELAAAANAAVPAMIQSAQGDGWRIRVDGPESPLEFTITPPQSIDSRTTSGPASI